MTIFFPLIYLFAGWLLGKTAWDCKTAASWILTRIAIPIVIIFNISTRFHSMSTIIIATAISMMVLLLAGRYVFADPIKNLCFSYLNIGWLGLPVASVLFGNDAATIIIAAYVGSSIVGNSLGAGMLSGEKFNPITLMRTPPVIALMIGAALIPLSDLVALHFDSLYQIAKFMMSFLGMAVLGIWLSKTTISMRDFRLELRPFLTRSIVFAVLVSLLLLIADQFNAPLITQNPATMYLFCLLPPGSQYYRARDALPGHWKFSAGDFMWDLYQYRCDSALFGCCFGWQSVRDMGLRGCLNGLT